ncbi:hypothetical protein BU24DRAFT_413754 [Aaosphaeria arxii CBS 175.79]|uniref:Lytic polysaccharide monooxygenase n=1 Tax=Aaosphaeria arxii CBS 175.79 TaxID=1450172 RepID=A0A6A5XDY6_9PLEO|nr:uncharacterized protein BU24DRAFT_413754 [Aaosphaeria arxii CBS 175.79]KAF2011073.1 hypothetical protein BU24DRAFT_413754 [Aaosphaeria arxii CBS 175.79]
MLPCRKYMHLLKGAALLSNIPLVTSQAPTPSSTQPSIIEQPIFRPTREDVLIPGGTFKIEWTPDKHFENVTLELWDKTSWGYSRDFGSLCYHWVNPFCGTIASHAPNNGSFEWQIPKPGSDFPRGERVYWIKMYVDDYIKPDIGNKDPVLSYSPNFMFIPENGEIPPPEQQTITNTMSSPPTLWPSPETVFVTVTDGSFITGAPPVAFTTTSLSSNASQTASLNSTVPTSSEGAAPGWKVSISWLFVLSLGLI